MKNTQHQMNDKYIARVNKLSVGRSTTIPGYGKVTAYKAANGKYGARRFKVTGSKVVANGGNLKLSVISADIRAYAR